MPNIGLTTSFLVNNAILLAQNNNTSFNLLTFYEQGLIA